MCGIKRERDYDKTEHRKILTVARTIIAFLATVFWKKEWKNLGIQEIISNDGWEFSLSPLQKCVWRGRLELLFTAMHRWWMEFRSVDGWVEVVIVDFLLPGCYSSLCHCTYSTVCTPVLQYLGCGISQKIRIDFCRKWLFKHDLSIRTTGVFYKLLQLK